MKKIKKIISLLILFILIPLACGQSSYFKLDIGYGYGELRLLNNEVVKDWTSNLPGIYSAEIISFDNKTLYKSFFDIALVQAYDSFNESGNIVAGGVDNLNYTNFTLYLPYYENAKSIEIYDDLNDNFLLSIDVSKFSKNLCGDGICQSWEVGKCADCEKAEVPAAGTSKGISETIGGISLLVIAIVILAIVLIVLIILLLRKKEKPYEFISPSSE